MSVPSSALRLLSIPAAVAAAVSLAGCAPDTCHAGFTANDDGVCLRNHYGASDSNGGSGGSAPVGELSQSRFASDVDGTAFLEVWLTAEDADDDLVGGEVHILLDGTGNYVRPVVDGVEADLNYVDARYTDPDLYFWIQNVTAAEHDADVTLIDAAGHVAPPLTLHFSAAPQ